MTEPCSMQSEFRHMQEDIVEIKQTMKEDAKEVTKEMMGMRDSKIRTEIALEAIIKNQESTNKNQSELLVGIQELRDKPYNSWKQMSWLWKSTIIGAIVSYVIGNYVTFTKMFGK